MKLIWKVICSIVAGAGIFAFGAMASAANINISQCTAKKFKVTAYYSPVKGQSFYYRGNYKDEVTLNGFGTHGASGKAVFHGMLAGPKSYLFGTKIYFPGWGVGEVADRGGAIVKKGERNDATYDRIDVWAGKGEEGLKKALSFGVQYLDAYVCPKNTFVRKMGLNHNKFPQYDDFFHASLRVVSLWPDRKDRRVKSLQDYLISMKYMKKGRNTGYYGNETKAAVCKYQQDWLGMSGESEWCGYFGPQTRYHMKWRVKELGLSNLYGPTWSASLGAEEGVSTAEQQQQVIVEQVNKKEITTTIGGSIPLKEPTTLDKRIVDHMFTKGEFKNYKFMKPFVKGDTGKSVKILERKLAFLGYLPYERAAGGVYNSEVIQAIYKFQLDNNILTGDEDMKVWGYLGTKTREVMNRM